MASSLAIACAPSAVDAFFAQNRIKAIHYALLGLGLLALGVATTWYIVMQAEQLDISDILKGR